MKQFIVLCAILPLLLIFMLQFTLDQTISAKSGIVADMVYAAKEEAKQAGCFTADIQSRLRANLSQALGISADEIEITATEDVRYRLTDTSGDLSRGLIYYKVSVPIGDAMAGMGFFGLGRNNTYVCTVESYAASEKLP